ncbi:MAG: hypothetical protein AUJ85_05200 [Elusimicrobia bacterium CG1_02_37_114]|nr:MAG: hypothetical protein AUJ85_05200 [Elusimicrobia bacterium CG1_02_37_114]PIV53740.1 MAG: hypothetical protein COS17_02195 [Elusimicrobia bacterium CG02_land_8_20_14_3_00_37_13]PIZ13527.1 MAG: hypothetical protein COY53_04360 [Elusimicrobia bacterium CG_4_10_14_0_8_um_filter_37_32]
MNITQKSQKLLTTIAEIGREYSAKPDIHLIDPFNHFFDKNKNLILNELDKQDGPWTRRELITRFLLLNAVLDQGPDIEGLRQLLIKVTNELYQREVRILHRPLDFFKELGISIDKICTVHEGIKKVRAPIWAKENQSNPEKYNLFMDNSKQVLNYAVFRWGVPLCVPLILEKDGKTLIDYLERCNSAELMSKEIKDNERYGLGKAIGDKAGHLFAKWYVCSFNLARRQDKGWQNLSFEIPFDSNAGRIFFRTGFLLNWANIKDYIEWEVVQKGKGKGGLNYIRVTNIRGKKSDVALKDNGLFERYKTICAEYLSTKKRPRTIEIQQIPNALLLNTDYGIDELDNGLIYIGTNFCLNHENSKCKDCPIKELCEGYNSNPDLIQNYRT